MVVKGGTGVRLGAVVAGFVLALGIATAQRAEAAGMTTHAWMAQAGIKHVGEPKLKRLLNTHTLAVQSGAAFPDSGYIIGGFYAGGEYGEISHWERFINAFIQHIRAKAARGDCDVGGVLALLKVDPLANPASPCAPLVAHLMGAAAHGVGDEMWDWMFEPYYADMGEDPGSHSRFENYHGHEALAAFSAELADSVRDYEGQLLRGRLGPLDFGFPGNLLYTSEYIGDVVAINRHGRVLWSPTPPPIDDLIAVYDAIGYGQIDEAGLVGGHAAVNGVLAAERLSALDYPSVQMGFPWVTRNMRFESGGVEDVGVAVGGYYEAIWQKLHAPQDETPRPFVTSVHPEPGETGVPYQWQPPQTQPGPYPDRGGAEKRIIAVLSNALDSGTVNSQNFKLLDPDGNEVPPLAGHPRPGPYGNGDGTHTMLFYPATDLEPCSTYTAVVTTGLRDWAPGAPGWSQSGLASDHEWSFTTRSADGDAC